MFVHFQPDISNYSEQVMPVLFSYLDNLCQVMKEHGELTKQPEHMTRMFYALEMFCENLNERLTPYLPAVVDRLLSIFVSPVSVKVRELAISALNSAGKYRTNYHDILSICVHISILTSF